MGLLERRSGLLPKMRKSYLGNRQEPAAHGNYGMLHHGLVGSTHVGQTGSVWGLVYQNLEVRKSWLWCQKSSLPHL